MTDIQEPNPFGYSDHTAFSSIGAVLVYGERPDGSLVHISKVTRGLACDCVCPACGRQLVARKGTRKIEHFGHYGPNSGCGMSAETNAHIWAKAVLEREKLLRLPAVEARIGKDKLLAYEENIFSFASVELEKSLGDIVPDVVLSTKDGQKLFVEVFVTHPCGPDKVAKLHDRGISTIEIKMSAWRQSNNRQVIEHALIHSAPRYWLYNRKLPEVESKLRKQIEERAAAEAEYARSQELQAAAKKREAEERRKRNLQQRAEFLKKEINSTRNTKSNVGIAELHSIKLMPRTRQLLWPGQGTNGFLVPNERWQAALIDRIQKFAAIADYSTHSFDLEDCIQWIRDCIPKALQEDVPSDVRNLLPSEVKSSFLPFQAVNYFLHILCEQEFLEINILGRFTLHENRARELKAESKKQQLRIRRQCSIDRTMNTILQAIPEAERTSFSSESWQNQPIPSFKLTLNDLVNAENEIYARFDQSLLAIELMINGGAPVEETLGLPLDGELERARGRELKKAEQAADDREMSLREYATSALRSEASVWLYTPIAGDTPVQMARKNPERFKEALKELENERLLFERKMATEKRAADYRQLLKTAAKKSLGPALTEAFLNNYAASLQSTPWKICTDYEGLRLAEVELSRWITRHQRSRRR